MIIPRSTLIAAILWTAAWPSIAAKQVPQAKNDPAATPVSPLAAQPLDRFSVTRERPLFSPSRRPPAPPAAVATPPPPPPPPAPDVVLLGVVVDGEDANALIRTGRAAKILRVRIGDKIGGWKVGQIEARKLVLLLDGRTATFTIFGAKNAKPSPSAAGAAAPPKAHQIAPNESDPIPPSRRRPPRQSRYN